LLEEQASMFVDFSRIIIDYALNVWNHKEINTLIKKIINTLAESWKKPSFNTLIGTESLQEYENKRSKLLSVVR